MAPRPVHLRAKVRRSVVNMWPGRSWPARGGMTALVAFVVAGALGAAAPAAAVATPVPVPGTYVFNGAACASAASCYAVGYNTSSVGVVVLITDGTPGTVEAVTGTVVISGVVCPPEASVSQSAKARPVPGRWCPSPPMGHRAAPSRCRGRPSSSALPAPPQRPVRLWGPQLHWRRRRADRGRSAGDPRRGARDGRAVSHCLSHCDVLLDGGHL